MSTTTAAPNLPNTCTLLTMIPAFLSVPTDETEHPAQRGFRLAQRDTTSVSRIGFLFYCVGLYRHEKAPVYRAQGGFRAEIRGNNDRLYDLDAAEYFGYLFIRTPATRSSGVALSGPRNESRAVDATKRELLGLVESLSI